jgi:hypothetical protein
MKKLISALLFLCFSFNLSAQSEEKRTFSELKKIIIKGNFEVILVESEQNFVQYKSETDITSDKILTVVKGEELFVSINDKIKPKKLEKVTLTVGYKKIKALEMEDFLSLQVKNSLNIDELELDFAGETQSTIDGKFKELKVHISEKASLKLTGECKNFDIEGEDDAFLAAPDFVCENIEIEVKGKGSYVVNAVKSLEASLSGEGEIVYKGQPKKTKFETKGGGLIKPFQ